MSRWLAAFRQALEHGAAPCANGANSAKTSGGQDLQEGFGTIGAIGTTGNSENRLPIGPEGDDAGAWRAWIETEARRRRATGDTWAQARRYACSSALDAWNRRHPLAPIAGRCAGCSQALAPEIAMDLADGASVHQDADLACLIAHGRRWRERAYAALVALNVIDADEPHHDCD